MNFFIDINKLLQLLNRKEKRRFLFLIFFSVIIAFLESISISSIVPFMSLALDPEMLKKSNILGFLYNYFNFEAFNSFVITLGCIVFSLLTATNFLGLILIKMMNQYVSDCNTSISHRLLKTYINYDYEFFINSNSSEILKNIVSEVQLMVFNFLQPLVNVIVKSFLIFGLFIMLLLINPLITSIAVFVFLSSYMLSYLLTNKTSISLGKSREKIDTKRFLFLSNIVGGIKEIKLFNTEEFFVQRFKNEAFKFGNTVAKQATISVIPKHVIESIIYGGLVLTIIISISVVYDVEKLIPLLILFGLAGFRIIPSLQLVYTSILRMRFYSKTLNTIHKLNSERKIKTKALDQAANLDTEFESIKLEDISFTYDNTSKDILKNISINIKKGEKIGLVGKTGSGKSSLVNLMLGLLKPTSGNIFFNNELITSSNFIFKNEVGHVSQQLFFLDGTLKENIFFGEEFDDERLLKVYEICCLDDFLSKYKNKFDYYIGENGSRLSGGQRQRLAFARALVRNPSILIIDEGSNALDNITENKIFNNIINKTEVSSMIIISHKLKSLIECDRILLLDNGEIVDQGTYKKLSETNELFQSLIKFE